MGEWQPIETAPKHARRERPIQLLAFAADPHGGDYHYFGVAEWSWGDPDLNSTDGWFWTYAIRPTHWQALPDPPTSPASSTLSPLPAAPYPDEQQQPYSGPNSGPSRTGHDR